MNNPEELQHFLDVLLSESNFTRAAKKLYISQPYLTQLIKRIEKRLGTKIINRDEPPYTLTPAGQIYYQYLENIAYNNQQLNKKLTSFTHPDQEIIRIGILESLGTFLLPEILPTFLKNNPNVRVQLYEDIPRKSEKHLLNGEIDCYIGQTPEALDSNLDVTTNGSEHYYVVISPASPYYQRNKFILQPDEIDLKVLLKQPMVLSAPGSAIRHQVDGLFQRLRLKPNIVLESKSIITATNLALDGVGLTISAASILKKMGPTPINLLPLSSDLMQLVFFIATKKGTKLTPGLKNLLNTFENLNLKTDIK